MTDRDMLELAALAAGYWLYEPFRNGEFRAYQPGQPNNSFSWNPRDDDGESLRLAVKLKIDVKHYDDHVVAWFDGGYIGTGRIMHDGDPYAATRRAIVRAAAEIGRQMKEQSK